MDYCYYWFWSNYLFSLLLSSCAVLQVLIADKIIGALSHVLSLIVNFVIDLDHNELHTQVREIELEFLCALTNDVATHYEELQSVLDNFEIEEIRSRVGKKHMFLFYFYNVQLIIFFYD